MKQVPYHMWVGYYLLLLSQQEAHPRRILDACCGTGTMTQMLVEEGFEVAGFDLSEGMIEEARRKATANGLSIRFDVMDAAEARVEEPVDAVYSFFDSLNNITVPERLQMAFQCFADILVPGGSLIFDLNTSYAFEKEMFDQSQMAKTAALRYKWKGHWDPETKIIEVDMKFWYKDREFRELHRQRAYDRQEIETMLETAGFVEIRPYHSYTLSPPRYASDRIHWTAIKPQ